MTPPTGDDLEALLHSLAFPEMDLGFLGMGKTEEGTSEWFFQHETYVKWIRSNGGVWIKGKPGSGKSMLLRHVHDRLKESDAKDTGFVFFFFFHGRGTKLQKTSLGLYRSLLHQLLRKAPYAAPTELLARFQGAT
jgi:predicted ATPase